MCSLNCQHFTGEIWRTAKKKLIGLDWDRDRKWNFLIFTEKFALQLEIWDSIDVVHWKGSQNQGNFCVDWLSISILSTKLTQAFTPMVFIEIIIVFLLVLVEIFMFQCQSTTYEGWKYFFAHLERWASLDLSIYKYNAYKKH